MKFKEALDIPCGFRYVTDMLPVQSPYSKAVLKERAFITDKKELEREYDAVDEFIALLDSDSNLCAIVRHKLAGIRNTAHAIERLQSEGVADETHLFEIKVQSMLAREISGLLKEADISMTPIPDAREIIDMLDPDSLGVATFYVYDSYSERLRELRRQAKRAPDIAGREESIRQSLEEEAAVRKTLSIALHPYIETIRKIQIALIMTDLRLATATLMVSEGFCRPVFADNGDTSYCGLFHPQIKAILDKEDRQFQPIDICFGGELPTTIIGANMGGKTVTLKMLALAQLSSQFVLGAPAVSARIGIKDKVRLSVSDGQSVIDGLSSFGAEIKQLGKIIESARAGEKFLALVDEPARTTNPVEGAALASALVNVMRGRKADMVVTTHYNLRETHSRRLRVAGYENGRMNYSLLPTMESEIPHEALTIAAALGGDNEWLAAAADILEEK